MTAINKIEETDLVFFAENAYANNYQNIATKSAIYPGIGTVWGVSYCAHKLAGEAGEFNEHFGKAMRDDDLIIAEHTGDAYGVSTYKVQVMPLSAERRDALLKELGDILWYVSALCHELDTTMSDVMLMNLRKLYSRSQRNKLQGSGDER